MKTTLVFNILAVTFCIFYCCLCLTLVAYEVRIKSLIFPAEVSKIECSQRQYRPVQGGNTLWSKHRGLGFSFSSSLSSFSYFSVLCWASVLLWDLMHQLGCDPLVILMYEVLEQDRNCNAKLRVVMPTNTAGIDFWGLFCLWSLKPLMHEVFHFAVRCI